MVLLFQKGIVFEMTPHCALNRPFHHSIKTTALIEQALSIFCLPSSYQANPVSFSFLFLSVTKVLTYTRQLIYFTLPVTFWNEPISSLWCKLQLRGICLAHCWIPDYSNNVSAVTGGRKSECSPSWMECICSNILFRSQTPSFHCPLLTWNQFGT